MIPIKNEITGAVKIGAKYIKRRDVESGFMSKNYFVTYGTKLCSGRASRGSTCKTCLERIEILYKYSGSPDLFHRPIYEFVGTVVDYIS